MLKTIFAHPEFPSTVTGQRRGESITEGIREILEQDNHTILHGFRVEVTIKGNLLWLVQLDELLK